jgi:hypothetical protein
MNLLNISCRLSTPAVKNPHRCVKHFEARNKRIGNPRIRRYDIRPEACMSWYYPFLQASCVFMAKRIAHLLWVAAWKHIRRPADSSIKIHIFRNVQSLEAHHGRSQFSTFINTKGKSHDKKNAAQLHPCYTDETIHFFHLFLNFIEVFSAK